MGIEQWFEVGCDNRGATEDTLTIANTTLSENGREVPRGIHEQGWYGDERAPGDVDGR